jgi:hypothetical protein
MTNNINYQTLSLYDLHKKCENGDSKAISEWHRRWNANYPYLTEIKKLPSGATPGKKTIKHLKLKLYHD